MCIHGKGAYNYVVVEEKQVTTENGTKFLKMMKYQALCIKIKRTQLPSQEGELYTVEAIFQNSLPNN